MAATYAIIEVRIQKAIDAINTRENPNDRAEIAREFRVPYDRLRSRLRGYQSKTAVRELHNRALKPDQKSALRQYLIKINELGLSVRSDNWTTRWLNRRSDLFKAAERKNVHDSKVLKTHFDEFKEIIIKYGITKKNTWNFDETGCPYPAQSSFFAYSSDEVLTGHVTKSAT